LADLGALSGVNSSCANWISENGLIAGVSENGAIDPLTGLTEVRAVLWKEGQPTDLGTLGGYESLTAGVNNRGQVVGTATNAIPDPFCFFGFGTQCHAFLWQNGVMEDLGTLGGPDSFAFFGINERAQIVGGSYTDAIANPTTGLPTMDPFLWEKGKMRDLGTLGGTFGMAVLINNSGQVMGQSNQVGDSVMHGFSWERGVLTDLGSLFGGDVEVWWLNDVGEIVGSSKYPGGSPRHGFLWRKGVMTDLGTLDPDCSPMFSNSVAFAINSKEQIVGNSGCETTGVVAAVLWEKGGPAIDLNTLIPSNSDMQLVVGASINERGEIAGVGVLPDEDLRAFLLIPCDENHLDVEGCDFAMVDATEAAAPRSRLAILPNIDSLARTINPSQNWLRQRYRMLGQRPALRH
jgi:probable HAF family extracellular repeat protein